MKKRELNIEEVLEILYGKKAKAHYCQYPGCEAPAATAYALHLLCTDHHDLVSVEARVSMDTIAERFHWAKLRGE